MRSEDTQRSDRAGGIRSMRTTGQEMEGEVMEPNDMEPIPDDSIFQINEELFWRDRLPKMSARELFDRIHHLFPDHCESVLMLRRLMYEAYRRLNEADALRKENEELRKDKERIDFLDDGNYGMTRATFPAS